jgi:membrane protease YdiL (CAAX protease family)
MTDPQPEPSLPLNPRFEPPAEPYPFWGWADVLILVGLAVPVLVFTSMLVAAAAFTIEWLPQVKAVLPLTATFVVYGLMLLLFRQYFHLRYGRPLLASLGWVAPRPLRISALIWGVLLAFGCIILGNLLQTPEEKTPLDHLLTDPISIALMGVFAIALAPVFEELLFRGFLFPLIARRLGPLAGAALAALPFALLHGPEYAWSWQRISIVFLAGFAFGWMRHHTGSTAAAAVMHAGYNGTFVLVLAISRYGGWST